MKPAFVVNNRNKGRWVYKAVAGALAQTYPCEVIISDFKSTDDSCQWIEKAISECPMGAEHDVRFLHCDLPNPESKMVSMNDHFWWITKQTEAEWIFQCSSDDYSLPERVKVCMNAVAKHKASAVATTMFFLEPNVELKADQSYPTSGEPKETGYVHPGNSLYKLVYGSVIAGYHRSFLDKIGPAGPCTMDVYYGFLAALHYGFYAIAEPHHVHVTHRNADNIGFQGKMRAAEESGDQEQMTRINELNRFQLSQLYYYTAMAQQKHFPLCHDVDKISVRQMFTDQCVGWLKEREKMHENRWMPGVI